MADGGFEEGTPNPFWDEFSQQFGSPICSAKRCGDFFGGPFEGNWWAWFGGSAQPETGRLSQTVTIPPGTAALKFWLDINLASGNGTDFLTASLDGNVLFTALESDAGTYHPWTQVVIDVTAFADGGSHLLSLDSTTTAFTNFYVDTVEITVEVQCPEDLDGNGDVGFSALLLVLAAWGPCR